MVLPASARDRSHAAHHPGRSGEGAGALRQPTGSRPHRRDAARRRSVHRRGSAGGHVDRCRHRAARRSGRPRTLLRSDARQHASPADVGLEVDRGVCLRDPGLEAPPGPRGACHAVRSGDRRLRVRRRHRATPPRHAHRRRVQRGLRGPRRRGARHGAPHGLASRTRARERRPVRLSHLAVLARAPRRPVRLPLGGHRRSGLGVRAGRRRPDGRPGVHPDLGADGRRVRRRDHL